MSGGMVDSIKFPLVTNMVLFAAVYIVSDKRIAPRRHYYAFFYGLFIAMTSYIIVLTTAKENAIVIVALLFTPIALAFKNLEKRIDDLEIQALSVAAQKSEITAEEETEAAPEPEEISKPDDSLDEEAFDLPEFSINEINELIEAEHLADTDEEQNAEEVTGDEE